MQSGTGHSGIDRKKGILGMQGQSSAGDKIKSKHQTRRTWKERDSKTFPLVSARIIPSSLQFLFKCFLCFLCDPSCFVAHFHRACRWWLGRKSFQLSTTRENQARKWQMCMIRRVQGTVCRV